jgi:hypothetical protein
MNGAPEEKHRHFLKLRFCISVIMLALGFLGIIITDVRKDGAWDFWRVIAILYALCSLSLSLLLHKSRARATLMTLWQELLHWVGLILAIGVVAYFVKSGIVGRFEAGLEVLTLLALATYLAGVYIEVTFIPLGCALGIFSIAIAFFSSYLYLLIIPLTLLVVLGFILLLKFHKP